MSLSIDEPTAPPEPPAEAAPVANPLIDPEGLQPIRAELFGIERLEAHARQLAEACVLAPRQRAGSPLLRRFADNGRALVRAHKRILETGDQQQGRSLDAEWLVDNFHIVEDVLREIRQDLPPGYDEELPKLDPEPVEGYPRVYALALSLVAHTDGELDEARIGRFVDAFQTVVPLDIGELWAVPTMLRLVLLENLRRLAEQMLWGWDERRLAEDWAKHLLTNRDGEPTGESFPTLSDPFAVRLTQLLRDQGTAASSALVRLERRLLEQGNEPNEVLHREHARQAASQVSVGNSVTTLRLLSALDWNDFFEAHSAVEAVLRDEPTGVYARQDFATRDRQRRAVEGLARRSAADEVTVARRSVALAKAGAAQGPPQGQVGYYLIGPGRSRLNSDLGYRATVYESLLRAVLDHPRAVYFGSIAILIGLFITGLLLAAAALTGTLLAWQAVVLTFLLLLPVSELAVGLVNHGMTLVLPPRVLPKLEFKDGISKDCATMVVMPTMLIRPGSAATLLERLEIHFLANPDSQVRFALLTDFADSPTEHAPEDEMYVRAALEGVKALNERYAAGGPERFFVFHRRRLWNASEGCWMGWERKRGKLAEFNRLLLGDRDTSYVAMSADLSNLPPVRFIITLDADTQLPRESAHRLVGTLAHPLNQPRFDPQSGLVVEGYGVLQPRVSFHLTATTRSRFSRLLAASAGIDPYATAVSDHYMDLFGSGSFTGKGIYDLRAFEAATGRTFPENHVLSHDLIEGNFARCGLVSDIELFDDFPPRYHAYARREHRWVRGDWQLLPWLGRTVPTAEGPRPNPLPTLERWKLFDNLRRSLVPPALLVLLALGWTVLPGSPWLWTAVALAVPALPLVQLTNGTISGLLRGRSLGALRAWWDNALPTGAQGSLAFVLLADQARLMVDAIARTIIRLAITRRRLLEWETAATTERRLGPGFKEFWISVWPGSALGAALLLFVAFLRPEVLVVAVPCAALWLVSPAIAYWVSQPRRPGEAPLTEDERRVLRGIARRTWHFFETFVGEDDQWLPPDNYQETPTPKVAHRTSPTNQGLLLLSTLAAHDFGFIGLRTMVDRLEKTFSTLEMLERHRGHFYNWYDTQTLRPLPPGYISTVDSGNLLGCLIALKQGLREATHEILSGDRLSGGLADTLGLALEALRLTKSPAEPEAAELFRELGDDLQRVGRQLEARPCDLLVYDDWLDKLEGSTLGLLESIDALREGLGLAAQELETWVRQFAAQARQFRADVTALAPWLAALRAWEKASAAPWPNEDLAARWRAARATLVTPTSLAVIATRMGPLRTEIAALELADPAGAGLHKVVAALDQTVALDLADRLRQLADRAEGLAAEMDFRFLFKPERQLFSIGYNLAAGRLDGACYDLLASEASLTSFLMVARGEAPRRHWFQLGRPFIRAAGRVGLLSWGGTMFEYLMPRLLLRALDGTLLAQANRTAIERQVEYGRQMGVPWGVSESAFAARYVDGDYKYQSFGVPGLGLKRGLDQDLVVAPYATALAVPLRPREAMENFRRLAAEGAEGPYGFHEAIDYTRDRVPKGRRSVVVRSFMAHHQGMSLVALANALHEHAMPRRFHAEPMVRAAELLLQERVPRDAPVVEPSETTAAPAKAPKEGVHLLSRRLTTAATPAPRVHLLSNAQYSVMITNAGSGYSTCHGLDVTRWREDATRDSWGQFCYLRQGDRGPVWSAGYQPTCRAAQEYEVIFAADKASVRRLDGEIETLLEVAVSPEHLVECRRLTITNHGESARNVELTSYAEIVLGPRGADMAHPAFGKLFLETEWLPGPKALLCRRRPRAHEEKPLWAVHVSAVEGVEAAEVQFETDRARFLGRGRTLADPAALDPGATLSGTTGPVLDPIVSLRRRVHMEAGASATVAFTTGFANTRESALSLADQYCAINAVARVFELSWAHSQVEHRHRNWSPEDALLFQRLAAHIIHTGTSLRAAPAVVAANRQGQPGLWRYGISGDRPIVLARIGDTSTLGLARQLLVAHSFLRLKGLEFDLVLLGEQESGYYEELHGELEALVRGGDEHDLVDKPGGIFVRKVGPMPREDRVLLQAAARVVLLGDRGTLAAQLDRVERVYPLPEEFVATKPAPKPQASQGLPAPALLFTNGSGGFSEDGREYLVTLSAISTAPRYSQRATAALPGHMGLPPAPWINVVANPAAGFLISEAGSGYTWAGNSQQNRITPWNNDPVSDPPGEVVYLRDEETGDLWSPTPLPVQSGAPTLVRHGQGYTTFQRVVSGIEHELSLFVAPTDPIKLLRLRVKNSEGRARRLTATYYADVVLGSARELARMHVVTELDSETGALLARSAWRTDFAAHVTFADVDRRPRTVTADRTEFLGRHGSVAAPAALRRTALSGHVGAELDPCAALQVHLELQPGQEQVVTFLLGEAKDLASARGLVQRYREPGRAADTLDAIRAQWDRILGTIHVQTPNPALDLLLNRWLPYQVLSCRVWGRSAFYQSGGAYGFRDQLQDVMALVYGAPNEARAQILRAAARQFVEGDVQHWWHPPAGRGVRTRFSDDLLWLPFIVTHYVRTTGDTALLDERVPYIEGPLLKEGQDEDFGQPKVSERTDSVYEHCLAAFQRGMKVGAHGLPLMGTGDWNDGMNRVGDQGKGESVWDAWFLIAGQRGFADLAEARGEQDTARKLRDQAEALRDAVESEAWDGAWYRRAYFDDGTPLGSAENDECQIDSIAQTWAVISGAGDPQRSRQAMDSVEQRLVREQDGLILLFTPPFDKGSLQPGYIKGYVPGIRENGGQYTHAATWVVQATALLGRGRRAMELFDLVSPVGHSATAEAVTRYKVEPYVVAADIYGAPPHTGRGGWTWYTGSASWLYRIGLESILGFHRRGQALTVDPCIPGDWPGFAIRYRHGSATYQIRVENPGGAETGVRTVVVDGQPRDDRVIPLADDGREHEVLITMK
jgi:cyclic beta-1,2-glucan synthetase